MIKHKLKNALLQMDIAVNKKKEKFEWDEREK